jgi:hypothetical protein
MAIAITLPSVSADPTDTIIGQTVIFSFTPSGGSNGNVRAKIASINAAVEKAERKAYNSTSGYIDTDRTVVTSVKWTVRLTLDEFGTTAMTYINNAYQAGEGRMWIVDPDDAANTVALLSNNFNCTVSPDGDISFQGDQFSEFNIVVDIAGTFSWTADGATV